MTQDLAWHSFAYFAPWRDVSSLPEFKESAISAESLFNSWSQCDRLGILKPFLCFNCAFTEQDSEPQLTENDIAKVIVDCAYKVHTTLGPGLLETVYEAVLAYELEKRGLHAERQKRLPVFYENIRLEEGYRADLVVSSLVIVELKSVEETAPVHKKQLLTYLRLADKRLGLLINFGKDRIRDGITRIANGLPE